MQDLGRRVFGFAATLLGAVELISRDFATVWEPVPDNMPGRTAAAMLVAILFVASGIGLQWRRTASAAAAVIGLVYLVFVSLWLRRVIGYPGIFATWGGTAEELAPCLAAIVLFLEFRGRSEARVTGALRSCAILYGLCAIAFGFNHFFNMGFTAGMVPSWIPPSQWTWALLTGIFDVLGGVAIMAGILATPAARLLTLMYAGFGVFIWVPRLFSDPAKTSAWMGNAVNLSIVGAAWVFADLIKRHDQGFGSLVEWIRQRRRGRYAAKR